MKREEKSISKKKKKYRFEKHVTVNKNTYIQFKRIFDKKKSNKFIAFWINSDLDKVINNKLNVNDNSYSVEINNVQ